MNNDTRRRIFDLTIWIAGLVTAAFLVADASAAEHKALTATNPTWKAECGSCHVPYPPGLLPAASWRAMMNGLDRHFGTDASVDAKTATLIGGFLEQNAARERGNSADPPTLRITDTRWFRQEHSHVARAAATNRADCAACHRAATSGDYSERNIRLPQ